MSVFALLGLVLFTLIVFQVLSGKRIISVPIRWHRGVGALLFIIAALKGLLSILVRFL